LRISRAGPAKRDDAGDGRLAVEHGHRSTVSYGTEVRSRLIKLAERVGFFEPEAVNSKDEKE
jgi:hypothetical protein